MMIIKFIVVIVLNLIFVALHVQARDPLVFLPCGNNLAGFIQFVKWKDSVDNVWTASFNLSYYPHLQDALIKINFEPLVSLKKVYNACRIVITGNNLTGSEWVFQPKGGMGKVYTLDVQPLALYPSILNLTVNGYSVCAPNPILSSPTTSTLASVNLNTIQNNQGQANTNSQISCGTRPANYLSLVFQGDESTIGQWPWHVAIFYQKEKNGKKSYCCGGSLLSRNIVLTAAHCVVKYGYPVDPRNIFVLAGEIVLYTNTSNAQESPGKEIIVYPLYTSKPGKADIALIKTHFCFIFNDYVQPVCLMGPGYNKRSLTDLYATVVGFGSTENGTLSNVLRYTLVKIQNDATCLLSDILYQKLLDDFNFCAGNGPNSNTNPCNGDSGGGLVIEYDFGGYRKWVIQGIVSVAKRDPFRNQCDPTQYVVYTAVIPYYQWIMEHL